MQSKLLEAYRNASALPASLDGTFPAAAIAGRVGDYISVGPGREPVLLLSCIAAGDLRRPPIVLLRLAVEYGVRYRVRTSVEVVEGDFVVVSLRGDDLALSEAFCLAGDALIAALPIDPAASDVDRVVRQLVEMMTALSLPSSRAVAGLWAELWLVSVSRSRHAAVAAWHSDPVERFDFAFDTHFAEVKATEREERTHEFSYEQLRRSELPVRIISLRLRRAQNGTSLAGLVNALQAGMPPDMRTKMLHNVFAAIGSAISEASEIRFDETFAEAQLWTVGADQVPAVVIPAGSPISAVRFRVNLDDSSLAAALTRQDARDVLVAPPEPRS